MCLLTRFLSPQMSSFRKATICVAEMGSACLRLPNFFCTLGPSKSTQIPLASEHFCTRVDRPSERPGVGKLRTRVCKWSEILVIARTFSHLPAEETDVQSPIKSTRLHAHRPVVRMSRIEKSQKINGCARPHDFFCSFRVADSTSVVSECVNINLMRDCTSVSAAEECTKIRATT
jgi:hypothetical protein